MDKETETTVTEETKETDTGEASETKEAADGGGKAGSEQPPTKTFTQEDIDAAVAAAKADWDKQAKLANLPEDEKAREKLKQDREKFDKERADLDKRILMQDARDMLAEKGIPASFAKYIIGVDKKETQANVEEFAKEWSTQVSASVDAKLKGGKPPKAGDKKDPVDPFLAGLGL